MLRAPTAHAPKNHPTNGSPVFHLSPSLPFSPSLSPSPSLFLFLSLSLSYPFLEPPTHYSEAPSRAKSRVDRGDTVTRHLYARYISGRRKRKRRGGSGKGRAQPRLSNPFLPLRLLLTSLVTVAGRMVERLYFYYHFQTEGEEFALERRISVRIVTLSWYGSR